MPDTMRALVFDRKKHDWATTTGLWKTEVPRPRLDEVGADRSHALVRVLYAGFCGSDRGIWTRKAFGDMLLGSLEADAQDVRIVGHELVGEVVEVGARAAAKYGIKVGDVVSAESHIVCGVCYQCRHGQEHVCAKEKILGISHDGVFADIVRLPAKALWPTDPARIRLEVAAVQEPFGNAVHACQVTDLRGKRVAIFGTGTIGLFAILIAKGMGASQVVGIEPDPRHRELAARLGADPVFAPGPIDPNKPYAADPAVLTAIRELTAGLGVDVALEMSGAAPSLNTAIQATRRGGDVVMFGVRNGDAVIQDAHRIVMNGLRLHGVVGRRIFATWELTRSLLQHRENGIQDAIWDVILNRGEGPIVDIGDWDRASFEQVMARWPKPLIRFGG